MSSTSSQGSNDEDPPPPVDTTIVLTSDHCRAVIHTDTKSRVCGLLKSQCNRSGHKGSEVERGEPGAYTSLGLQRNNSPAPDGDFYDYIPLAEWEADDARRATLQTAENAAVGSLPEVSQPFLHSPYASAKNDSTEDEDDGISPSLKAQTAGFVQKASVGFQRLMRSPSVKQSVKSVKTLRSPNQKRLDDAKRAEAELARQLEEAERESERAERERVAAQNAAALAAQQEDADKGKQADLIERNIEQMKMALAALEARKAALRATPMVPVSARGLGLSPSSEDATPPAVHPSGQETSGRRLQVRGGQDPNHDDDMIYGVPKVMEAAVFAQLVPTELDARTKGELESLLPDVVAPTLGTFGSTSESAQDDVTSGLLNALEFHNNVDPPSRGGFVKKDASWNTTGRVGLYKVKTQNDFARLLYGYQIRERDFQERFSGRVRAVLIHFGYSDVDAAHFAESSRYVLICVRAHFLYGQLLYHLEKEIDRTSFKLVKPVIDLFAVELVGFRDDISRLSMWLSTYVYLRRVVRDNFWSRERQGLLNRAMLDGFRTDSGAHDSGHPEPGLCAHCGSHPPGHCPFKAAGLTKGVSKRLGKQAMAVGGRFQTSAKKLIDEHLANDADADEANDEQDEGKEKAKKKS